LNTAAVDEKMIDKCGEIIEMGIVQGNRSINPNLGAIELSPFHVTYLLTWDSNRSSVMALI
jgi:hypothetical protein